MLRRLIFSICSLLARKYLENVIIIVETFEISPELDWKCHGSKRLVNKRFYPKPTKLVSKDV